ncbi:MAG TPA: nitroreductase family deazaflavin-dependent oxidoreductase [Candidatus Limnocylindrales bacterium]|nr:nitroreductase family deazaflavin-dependent oxidoreductase [Candidatus Limnocylindrales bacterium]
MKASARSDRLSLSERLGLLIHRQLDRRLSRFGVWVMRRTRGALAGRFKVHALVLTVVGRKSGRSRSVVLQYFPDRDGFIVVATNDGGRTNPAWYLNLVASGGGDVEVAGRRIAVRANEMPGGEAATWWARILDVAPEYERYTRAAGRPFPIVRLTPLAPVALP